MAVHPQVYRFAASPLTDPCRAIAAVLQIPGSVASAQSALRLHGVTAAPAGVAVSVDETLGPRCDGVIVHRVGDLLPAHLDTQHGVPTTAVERAVVDATSACSPARLAHILDHLTITTRQTSIGAVGRTLRQVNRRGRINIGNLAAALDDRRPHEPAPRSKLERRVDDLLAPAPLPTPEREYPLPSNDGYRGFVDRAWLDVQLILEVDGRSWHARELAMASDRARDRIAASAGWQTIRVLDEELDSCADAVIDDVVGAHKVRTRQLGATA